MPETQEETMGAAQPDPNRKTTRRGYWYGRSRANRWPLWTSWLLAPTRDSRRIVRDLMHLRRSGVDV
jgi:hypothetical protein